jgi:hypothetical protein
VILQKNLTQVITRTQKYTRTQARTHTYILVIIKMAQKQIYSLLCPYAMEERRGQQLKQIQRVAKITSMDTQLLGAVNATKMGDVMYMFATIILTSGVIISSF